jgi:hypothetical protein
MNPLPKCSDVIPANGTRPITYPYPYPSPKPDTAVDSDNE